MNPMDTQPYTDADLAAWKGVVEVDKLTVVVLVDNETEGLSSPCYSCDPSQPGWSGGVTYRSEFTRLTQAFLEGKLQDMDFRHAVHAGHGLSLLLLAECGGVSHLLLLDAGPEPQLWKLNAERLGIKVEQLEAVVLSHWHPDHSGGLEAVAQLVSSARAQQPPAKTAVDPSPVLFDLHPDKPLRRGFQMPDGTKVPFNADVSLESLSLPGCRVELHSEAHSLLDGFFFVSGSIPRLTAYELGLPSHITQRDWSAGADPGPVNTVDPGEDPEGELWVRDPFIMDERYVAVRIKGRGAVIFSSCSHAGIVNVSRHAASLDEAAGGQSQLLGMVGGFHLGGRECEPRIPQTVQDLGPLLNQSAGGVVLAGHCTGWRAKAALAQELPRGHFQSLAAGGQYVFLGKV